MTLHLARSDGSESRGEERDNEIMLPIVLIRIIDQPVLRGRESKIKALFADEFYPFLGFRLGKRKNKKQQQG
jgi:hypothetical protein